MRLEDSPQTGSADSERCASDAVWKNDDEGVNISTILWLLDQQVWISFIDSSSITVSYLLNTAIANQKQSQLMFIANRDSKKKCRH